MGVNGTIDCFCGTLETSLSPLLGFTFKSCYLSTVELWEALMTCPVLYSRVKRVYVTICNMKLERRRSMFGVYWCFVVIFGLLKNSRDFIVLIFTFRKL